MEQPATLEDALAEVEALRVERDQFRLLHRDAQRAADSAERAVEALRMKLRARAGVFAPDMVAKIDQNLAGTDQSLDLMVGLYVAALALGTDLQAMVELGDLVDGMPHAVLGGYLVTAVRRLARQQDGAA